MRLIRKYHNLLYKALLVIVLVLSGNQIFIQFWLNKKSEDGLIINTAGRQRMLSQRINLLLLRESSIEVDYELDSTLNLWETNHYGLLETNQSLPYDAPDNIEVKKLLTSLNKDVQQIISIAKARRQEPDSSVNQLMDNYLISMDHAVSLLATKADQRLTIIVVIELILFSVSIVLLFFEMRFILFPIFRRLGNTIDEKDRLLEEKKAHVLWRHTEYLKSLHAMSISGYSSERKIKHIMELIGYHLELPVGIVSNINGELYTVRHCIENDHNIAQGDTYSLYDTICDITLNHKTGILFQDHPIFYVQNLKDSSFADHRAVKGSPLKAYIGIAIYLDKRLYGTINFSSTEARESFEEEDILMFLQAKEAIVYELQLIERRKLQEQNEELALITKSTHNAIIVTDQNKKITWVNDSFEKLTGYRSDEVLGQIPGSFLQGPDSDPVAINKMRKAIEENKPVNVEVVNYRKNGTPYWMSIDLQPIFDKQGQLKKFIGIQSNISEKKHLRLENDQLAVVAKKTNNAVIILDNKGKILWVNQGFVKLTGYSFGEIVGLADGFALLGPQTKKTDIDRVKIAIKKGESLQMEILIHNKSGDPCWIAIDLQPIKKTNGKVERFVILETDITEKVITQKNELIGEIRGEEKERNRISKDLHDGVGQMLVASRLLLSKLNEDTPVELILRQRDVLDALIGEMISETRLIINNLEVSLDQEKNFKNALSNLIEKSYRIFEGKINLEWTGNEEFEDFIYSINLFRIIQEALNNSIKYSYASTINISIDNNSSLKATVEDDGEGFDILHHKTQKGSGLHNMRSRAENLKLKFVLKSKAGQGTKISLRSQ